eukprot:1132174-Pleurochrysis_carterae.AAC.1
MARGSKRQQAHRIRMLFTSADRVLKGQRVPFRVIDHSASTPPSTGVPFSFRPIGNVSTGTLVS